MHTLTIDVLDDTKLQLLLDVLREFRFVQIASTQASSARVKTLLSPPTNTSNPEHELDALSWNMGVRSYTSREQLYER